MTDLQKEEKGKSVMDVDSPASDDKSEKIIYDDSEMKDGSSDEKSSSDSEKDGGDAEKSKNDQEIVLIQDTSFTVTITPPGSDSFELPVSSKFVSLKFLLATSMYLQVVIKECIYICIAYCLL